MLEPRLIIEPLSEIGREDNLLVTDDERLRAESFGTDSRRAEYLLWRHIVRRELGADTVIDYAPHGVPILKNRNEHIGVSHCREYVAVVVSPNRCAVDIESLSRNFSKVSSRYISAAESSLSRDSRLACALWCAKETLYKYSGRTGLDFLRDICVEKVDFAGGIIVGSICGGDSVTMQLAVHADCLVVWVG